MTTFQPAPRCRVISIASARPAQSHSALALIRGQRAINLAALAESIQSDLNLVYLVTEAACQELGCLWLSVEEAIVLLGGERICALVSDPSRHGRSASQLRRHRDRIAPAASPCCRLENFSEEPK